jgi:peroxiredoxin
VLPTLRTEGIALFAISYDAVAILSTFAARHEIAYPLLSDEGSHAMRRLGLINERVQDDHAFYGIGPNPKHVNLPYPGVFVLDRDGVVTHKRFYESYRVRDTGAGAVADLLGIEAPGGGAEASGGTDGVRVRAWLDSPTYAFFQRLRLTVELAIDPGLHVYAHPVPEGNVPLTVEVAPIDGMEIGAPQFPAAQRMTIEGVPDESWVFEDRPRVVVPLIFGAAPGSGDHVLRVTVKYQACSDSSCALPAAVELALPITEVPLAERTLPAPAHHGRIAGS